MNIAADISRRHLGTPTGFHHLAQGCLRSELPWVDREKTSLYFRLRRASAASISVSLQGSVFKCGFYKADAAVLNNERKRNLRGRSTVPKAFSPVLTFLLALACIVANCCADEPAALPSKLKPISVCSTISTAAVAN